MNMYIEHRQTVLCTTVLLTWNCFGDHLDQVVVLLHGVPDQELCATGEAIVARGDGTVRFQCDHVAPEYEIVL